MKRFTQNSATTQIMAGVVLFDAYCNCADIDARADGGSSPPLVLQLGAIFCLVLRLAWCVSVSTEAEVQFGGDSNPLQPRWEVDG